MPASPMTISQVAYSDHLTRLSTEMQIGKAATKEYFLEDRVYWEEETLYHVGAQYSQERSAFIHPSWMETPFPTASLRE